MCGVFELTCYVREWIIEPTIDSTLQAFANYAMTAFQASLVSYGAAWAHMPTVAFHNTEGASGFVFNNLHYWQMIAAIVATMFGGVKVAISRNSGQEMSQLGYMIFRMVIANGAIVLIVSTLATISDLTAAGIVNKVALNGKLDFSTMFTVSPDSPLQAASSVVMFLVFGLIGVVVNMVQTGILLLRSAMLVLLTGFIPITASVSNLEWGRDWYNKSVAWIFAFLLYKPVAALIYGFGITLLGTPGESKFDTFTSMALGIIVLLMGIFALPALIKFLTPAVASMGGGAGGGGMGLAVLAAGAFASRGGVSGGAAPTGSVSAASGSASTPPASGGSVSAPTVAASASRGPGGYSTGSAPTHSSNSASSGAPGEGSSGMATAAGAAAFVASGGSSTAAQIAASGVQKLSEGLQSQVNGEDMPGGARQ